MSEVTEVVLKDVILSFPKLFRAEAFKGGEGPKKFNGAFLIDKDTKQGKKNIAAMEAAIDAAMDEKWGDNLPKLKDDKFCLRDGDDEDIEGYEGRMYVSASNSKRPVIVDRDNKTPLTEEDGKLYAGCRVNAIVRVWAQDNDYGKRVNASLEAVQFFKDGEAFGAAPVDTSDKFDSYEDDEDEDEDEKPSRRRRSRDEDEDEKPSRRRRSRASEDEDDDEDDEDEDSGRRRRRSRR